MTVHVRVAVAKQAYKDTAAFERWVRRYLLPAVDGKVTYRSGRNKGSKYQHNVYADEVITGSTKGITVRFIIPAYNANEYPQDLGSIVLTWDQVERYAGKEPAGSDDS